MLWHRVIIMVMIMIMIMTTMVLHAKLPPSVHGVYQNLLVCVLCLCLRPFGCIDCSWTEALAVRHTLF